MLLNYKSLCHFVLKELRKCENQIKWNEWNLFHLVKCDGEPSVLQKMTHDFCCVLMCTSFNKKLS